MRYGPFDLSLDEIPESGIRRHEALWASQAAKLFLASVCPAILQPKAPAPKELNSEVISLEERKRKR